MGFDLRQALGQVSIEGDDQAADAVFSPLGQSPGAGAGSLDDPIRLVARGVDRQQRGLFRPQDFSDGLADRILDGLA